ncbi:F-box protein At3g07870-like [Macadamia integrifolia]|uniref:F-box protein At3g07870-like n=1 Tax=Macadamia integrifolia TaxID=60698 RepID=UPI001C4E828E|nr:F-box protein At3g07870-like [Macadamia integrifolia]
MKKHRQEEKKQWEEETRMSAMIPMPHLPIEIKDKIFLSLPVEALLRLRCIIRDYSRLYNPQFLKMHLDRQFEFDNGSIIIVSTASKIYKLSFDAFSHPIQLDFPFRNPNSKSPIVIAGSCNGLVCLTHKRFYGDYVYVWNPATGQYKQLPAHVKKRRVYNVRISLGFGYDHISGEFKVLLISNPQPWKTGIRKVEAIVYTLGTSSWRSIGDTSSWRSIGDLRYPFCQSPLQVFGGCPHWTVPELNSIVSFSVGNEKFKEIPMPPIDDDYTRWAKLTALGGCLSIVAHVYKEKCYEIWARVEDGLENTWTKQLSINAVHIPGYLTDSWNVDLKAFKNGQVLVEDDGPYLFDPVTNDIRYLYLLGDPKKFHVCSYIESLAPC